MSRKFQREGVAVAVLVLALLAATPAHAAGLSEWGQVPTLLHQAWQWLANVLPGGAGARAGLHSTGQDPRQEKVKLGVDPNGDPASATSSDADKGAGVDPNG